MSIRYVAAVLDSLPGLTASEKLVLVSLADYASDDTRECWPSINTIARRACCDRRTAQRVLRKLERRELIETKIGGHYDDSNVASAYRLMFDHSGQPIPPDESYPQGRRNAAPGAAATTGGGGIRSQRGRRNAAPSVIDPSLILRAIEKPKAGDKSAHPDRLEQLERLRKLHA